MRTIKISKREQFPIKNLTSWIDKQTKGTIDSKTTHTEASDSNEQILPTPNPIKIRINKKRLSEIEKGNEAIKNKLIVSAEVILAQQNAIDNLEKTTSIFKIWSNHYWRRYQ